MFTANMWWISASLLLPAVLAAPLGDYAVKETHVLPATFTRVDAAPQGQLLRLSIGLKQSRFDELEKQLYEVSDPDHVRYGQHLSQEQVNELIKPSDTSLKLVHEWLDQHIDLKAVEYTPARDFLSFIIPVAHAEELLDTKYSVYRHNEGFELTRALEWSIPKHLHEHIVAVQPTTSFLRPSAPKRIHKSQSTILRDRSHLLDKRDDSASSKLCKDQAVTLQCLRTLYQTIDYEPKAGQKNQIAVDEWDGERTNRSDAHVFLERYRPEAVSAADQFKLISVNGGTIAQGPDNKTQLEDGNGAESALDVQTVIGFAWPINLTVYSTAGHPPFISEPIQPQDGNEPYLTWLQYVLKQSFIPQVVSSSYLDPETTVPLSYAKVVCMHFAQLGARGVSTFVSSGDAGPGTNCSADGRKQFIAGFPAGCPYVTAVGGTQQFHPQIASTYFNSGGGFSGYFPRPQYQEAAVSGYLKTINDKYSQFYNKSGRGYPDLAAYSAHVEIAFDGKIAPLGSGTSQACPVAASVFSLLNDALISNGRPPMGFLNPWLYKKGYKVLEDVTKGSSPGCNTKGFPVTKGWDAVTGFGAPIFEPLLKAVGLEPSGYASGQAV